MLVVPNVMGVFLWAPPLDTWGNSCKGVLFCQVGQYLYNIPNLTFEPSHDKTNKKTVCPAKTQWVAKDLGFLHADSEDFDQTGRMPRLI